MTQKNIDIMNIIVSKLAEGETLSAAMKEVYTKRSVSIPYHEEWLACNIPELKMSLRTTGALMRHKIRTIGDVVNYTEKKRITSLPSLGMTCGVELFESILNYCWHQMTREEQIVFLIKTVEKNSENIKPELM